MTFTVEERYPKQYRIPGVSLAAYPGLSASWVFSFNDGRITDHITASSVRQVGGTEDIVCQFRIPDGFFAADRSGPLIHQVLLYNSEGTLVLWTEKVSDRLEKAVARKSDVIT